MNTRQATTDLLAGRRSDATAALQMLNDVLIPPAIKLLNEDILPAQIPIFPDDVTPTNQANLTDVRTRIGTLVEYQFATAVNQILPRLANPDEIGLTHVVANQFPDLAFRSATGELGIRLEIKAVQTIAEEKAANFYTLIKDIRKGRDFVVAFTWEWEEETTQAFLYPHIHHCYVMDAYQLAQMRNTYWLDTPPRENMGTGRQGFDLRFPVNAKASKFSQEEKNYGKLMRIFHPRKEHLLTGELLESETLRTYYHFKEETRYLGMRRIFETLVTQCDNARIEIVKAEKPIQWLVTDGQYRIGLIGAENMPTEKSARAAMSQMNTANVVTINKDFSWNVYSARKTDKVASGKKPEPAARWIRDNWRAVTPPSPLRLV